MTAQHWAGWIAATAASSAQIMVGAASSGFGSSGTGIGTLGAANNEDEIPFLDAQLATLYPVSSDLESICRQLPPLRPPGYSIGVPHQPTGDVLPSDASLPAFRLSDQRWTLHDDNNTRLTSPNSSSGMEWRSRAAIVESLRAQQEAVFGRELFLEQEFYTATYDPLPSLLDSSSLTSCYSSSSQDSPFSSPSHDNQNVIRRLQDRIEELDEAREALVWQLTARVEAHTEEILTYLRAAQAVDRDICTAVLHVGEGRRLLKVAGDALTSGFLRGQRLHLRRERQSRILLLAKQLQSVRRQMTTLSRMIHANQFDLAVVVVGDLTRQLVPLKKCLAVQNIVNEELPRHLATIQRRSERLLQWLSARHFDGLQYGMVVRTCVHLDLLSEYTTMDFSDSFEAEDLDSNSAGGSGSVSGLARNVLSAQISDVERCIRDAVWVVTQPRLSISTGTSFMAPVLTDEALEIPQHLLDKPLTRLINELDSRQRALCFANSCVLLAKLAHTLTEVARWHRMPFRGILHEDDPTELFVSTSQDVSQQDSQALDSARLRESGSAGIWQQLTSLGATMDDQVLSTFESSEFGKSLGVLPEVLRVCGLRLLSVHERLEQAVPVLWRAIFAGLTEALSRTTFYAEDDIDGSFTLMEAYLTALMKFGEKQCAGEGDITTQGVSATSVDTRSLRSIILEKQTQFIESCHLQTLLNLRMMIRTDGWFAVEIPADETLSRLFARISSTAALVMETSTTSNISVQPTQADDTAELTDDASLCCYDNLPGLGIGLTMFNVTPVVDVFADIPITRGSGVEAILSLCEDAAMGSSKSNTGSGSSGGMLVTQSLMHGVLRAILQYTGWMASYPSAAEVAWGKLRQLCDYFMASVFVRFTDEAEQQSFFSRPTRQTMIAPAFCKEFDILRSQLVTCFDEVIQTSPQGRALIAEEILPEEIDAALRLGGEHSSQSTSSDGGVLSTDNNSPTNMMLSGEGSPSSIVLLRTLLLASNLSPSSSKENYFGLSERITGAESCWWLSQTLIQVQRSLLFPLLPSHLYDDCSAYIRRTTQTCGQLRSLLYKNVSTQLLHSDQIIDQITSCVWDSRTLREHHHEWVDELLSHAACCWSFLSTPPTDNTSPTPGPAVLDQLWMEISQCAFSTVLEGYSRVTRCSSEGRSLMSMDLFALDDGLRAIHTTRSPHAKHRVDAYLRAFYLSEDEIGRWIRENWQSYTYSQVIHLITQTVPVGRKQRELLTEVNNTYDVEVKEQSSTLAVPKSLSARLAQRMREEKPITKLFFGRS